MADGSCRRCAYRKRLQGAFLCARCREDRDTERVQKRQDAIDAAAIDQFPAQPLPQLLIPPFAVQARRLRSSRLGHVGLLPASSGLPTNHPH